MIAIVYLNNGQVAIYEVEKESYFDVREDTERKLRNWGRSGRVIDIKFIKANNKLDGTRSELKTQSEFNIKL